MSTGNNNSYNDVTLLDIGMQRFYSIQFWIFLFLTIPSMMCSLFSLYHYFLDRTLRQSLKNHIIIVLLLINLFYEVTNISWYIHYFHSFQSFFPSPTFRLIWGYIDWAFYCLQLILYVWVTLERHILIFHGQWVPTRKKRFCVHYLPPIILTVYVLLYYTVIFFGIQCENSFDIPGIPNVIPCAFQNNAVFMYETVAHAIIPNLIIVISSLVLLLRVLWQKHHVHRQIHWRRHRKMTLQVLSISSIYLIFPFPYVLITLLHLCGVPSDFGAEFLTRATYFTYYTLLLFPIVSVGTLPELKKKIENIVQCRRQQRIVHPENLNMTDNHVVIRMRIMTRR